MGIDLRKYDVIKIAEPDDTKDCLNLLKQLGPINEFTNKLLYLENKENGFTLLVRNNNHTVAISTFSIRKKKNEIISLKMLYWENLVVDKDYRDGLAYIEILGYLKKLIKSKKYDDIYFVVRRKKAIETHKAARFSVIGHIYIIFSSICFQFRQHSSDNIEVLTYGDFSERLLNDLPKNNFSLQNFKGFDSVAKKELARQIFGKSGQVIIDKKNKKLQLIRTIFKSFFLQINLIFKDDNYDISKNLKCKKQPMITINFSLVKSTQNNQSCGIYIPFIKYKLLSFKKLIDFNTFKFWEHDAW